MVDEQMTGRRRVLQTITAGSLGAAALASGTTARDENESSLTEILSSADRIEREEGTKARDRFLDQEGYPSATKTGYVETTDDVGIEGIDDPGNGGIEVELQGIHEVPTGRFAFRLGATYSLRVVCDDSGFSALPVGDSFGRAPRDAAGIKWNSRQHEYWSLADGGGESVMIEEDHTEWDDQVHDPTVGRTAFRFDDEAISEDWLADQNWTCNIFTRDDPVSGWSARERCGIIVERARDHDASERVVRVTTLSPGWWTNIASEDSEWCSGARMPPP
jgi:hypothetical protein